MGLKIELSNITVASYNKFRKTGETRYLFNGVVEHSIYTALGGTRFIPVPNGGIAAYNICLSAATVLLKGSNILSYNKINNIVLTFRNNYSNFVGVRIGRRDTRYFVRIFIRGLPTTEYEFSYTVEGLTVLLLKVLLDREYNDNWANYIYNYLLQEVNIIKIKEKQKKNSK